jgi:hypothetical protein
MHGTLARGHHLDIRAVYAFDVEHPMQLVPTGVRSCPDASITAIRTQRQELWPGTRLREGHAIAECVAVCHGDGIPSMILSVPGYRVAGIVSSSFSFSLPPPPPSIHTGWGGSTKMRFALEASSGTTQPSHQQVGGRGDTCNDV